MNHESSAKLTSKNQLRIFVTDGYLTLWTKILPYMHNSIKFRNVMEVSQGLTRQGPNEKHLQLIFFQIH